MGGKLKDRNERLQFLKKVINTKSSLLGDINTKNTVKYDANQAIIMNKNEQDDLDLDLYLVTNYENIKDRYYKLVEEDRQGKEDDNNYMKDFRKQLNKRMSQQKNVNKAEKERVNTVLSNYSPPTTGKSSRAAELEKQIEAAKSAQAAKSAEATKPLSNCEKLKDMINSIPEEKKKEKCRNAAKYDARLKPVFDSILSDPTVAKGYKSMYDNDDPCKMYNQYINASKENPNAQNYNSGCEQKINEFNQAKNEDDNNSQPQVSNNSISNFNTTGRVPTGRVPTGRVPTGRVPTGRVPTGRVPTGRVPTKRGHYRIGGRERKSRKVVKRKTRRVKKVVKRKTRRVKKTKKVVKRKSRKTRRVKRG